MYSGQCDVTEFVFDCFAVGGATAALQGAALQKLFKQLSKQRG